MLTSEQKNRAAEAMREYLTAPRNPDGRTPLDVQAELDRDRVQLIDRELRPLVDRYLGGQRTLAEFKSTIDGINKRHEYWGFKGIKGQMFFNMVVNVSEDVDECDQELKAAIALPSGEEISRSRIKTFHSYVRRSAKSPSSVEALSRVARTPAASPSSSRTSGRFRTERRGRFITRTASTR